MRKAGILYIIVLIILLPLLLVEAREKKDFFQPEYYGTGTWDRDSLGNHRIKLTVAEESRAVLIRIPWRRRDLQPDKKRIIMVDPHTNQVINNVKILTITRELGEVVFQPVSGTGIYYLYYLPYITKGSRNYPKVIYREPVQTAEKQWLRELDLSDTGLKKMTKAEVVQFQAVDEFNSFYPMEIIATAAETAALVKSASKGYLVFPEIREHPIRMFRDLPWKWVREGTEKSFKGEAARNEYFTFQLGVFAARQKLEEVEISFSGLDRAKGTETIPAESFTCFNCSGIDWTGKEFNKKVAVEKRRIQPFWIGIDISPETVPGLYTGRVTVHPKGLSSTDIEVSLYISEEIKKDRGDDVPGLHSRLRWLDSGIAEDSDLVKPFTAVRREGNTLSILGRSVDLNQLGLPRQIHSYFSANNTHLQKRGREPLVAPVSFLVRDRQGRDLEWAKKELFSPEVQPGIARWTARAETGPVRLDLKASLEMDGCMEYKADLTVSQTMKISDIQLIIPFYKKAVPFLMGMGERGGYRPESIDWKWDVKRNQDGLWIGDVNCGLQVSFRDTNYVRPLNTNFYQLKPLKLPPSWYNQGKGGFRLRTEDDIVRLTAYSGSRTLVAGDTLHFYFRLLLTPFKLLDTKKHFKNRYYHRYEPVDEIKKEGANIINVHHATRINPFINYPFLRPEMMKAYIDSAHSRDMKVKIYYTVRELTNRAAELFALFSLGHEIIAPGKGGGFAWLQEHLEQDYIAGWLVPRLRDAAVINSGTSRWHNYYLEGLNWLVEHVGIDGLYIDDVAFDRTVMKRVRKILSRGRPQALIDLHSANQYNPRDGHAVSANLYLEHFPYLDRLWFGEYFDYSKSADFWLVEVSGIPFGLMGEMLQDGGNPWRGMVFGMTSRKPWAGDPSPLWKIWDEFDITESEMIGYWAVKSPVCCSTKDVLITCYKKDKSVLLALASWADEDVWISLDIDFRALGLDPHQVHLRAPAIRDFQEEAMFNPDDKILILKDKGRLIVVE